MSETWNPPWVMNSSLLTIQGMSASGLTVFPMGSPPLGPSLNTNTPSTITGLILWLDATQISGVVSGTSLSAWTDSSTSASHATQPSAASRPVYLTNAQNGNAVVSWSTGGRALLASNMSSLQNWTYAVAGRSRTTTGNQNFLSGGANGQIYTDGANYNIAYNTTLAGSAFTNSAWVTWVALISGSSSTLAVSGKTFFGDAGSINNAPVLHVGALSVTQRYINGEIGEVAIYNRLLPEAERLSLETYLRTKWATL